MKGWENLYMGGLNNKGPRRRLTSVYTTRTTNPIEFTRTDRSVVTVKSVTERENDQRGCREQGQTRVGNANQRRAFRSDSLTHSHRTPNLPQFMFNIFISKMLTNEQR